MTPRQCPDHPGRMDAQLGNCTHCRREAAATDHAAHVAAVRAALKTQPTREDQP